MQSLKLYLEWPPTVNSYYVQGRMTRGKRPSPRVLSHAGRVYRKKIVASVAEQLGLALPERKFYDLKSPLELRTYDDLCIPLAVPLRIITVKHPPDRRIRDLDNYNKALLDALTHAGLWEDDSLIDQHEDYRGVVLKGGLVRLSITLAGPLLPEDYWPE